MYIRTGKHPDSKFYTIMLRLMFGMRKPKMNILGMEISGKLKPSVKDVKRFKIGDHVFACTLG